MNSGNKMGRVKIRVPRPNSKKQIIIISVAVAVVIGLIATLILVFRGKGETDDFWENSDLSTANFTAYKIKDYTDGEVTSYTRGTHHGEISALYVYENEILVGIDETKEYQNDAMELKLDTTGENTESGVGIGNGMSLEDYATEIERVYDIGFEGSVRVINQRIYEGARLLRTVEAPTYCEVYLLRGSDVERYLISSNTAIVSKYELNELPSMTSYFVITKMADELDEDDIGRQMGDTEDGESG